VKRFAAVVVVGAALALVFSPRGPLGGFWAPSAQFPKPEGAVLAGFIAEGIVEAVAFGVGVAILLFGRRWFTTRAATPTKGDIAWLTACWLFASWLPHASLHQHIGMQPAQILPVEWIFHVGNIVALSALLWSLAASQRSATRQATQLGDHASSSLSPSTQD